jgi:hypothetical protein
MLYVLYEYITYKTSTADLKIIDNLIVSPDSLTLSVASSTNGLDYRSGSFWTEAAIDCLHVRSGGMISVKCRDTNFNSYVQI